MKKALCWMSETLLANPEKKRVAVLKEAEIRFDLSPAECEFLDKNFNDPARLEPC
ncbi:hypothetical protein ACUUL3_06490 [Thiovibrio sp. JS02]